MSVKNLPLAARTTVDGFMAGINKSKVKGPGLEFSQYRSYQPGDDLRQLDWKMYARSDRYYIRESEIETSISIRFLIDASASMDHEDNGYSKIDFARYIAASLGYLAHMQNDSVGLYVFRHDRVFMLPARKDHQHMSRFYYQLETISPQGDFTGPLQYKEIFSGSHKREFLVFITDLYQRDDEILKMLDSLSLMKHEILVFHLMGNNELLLDYPGYTSLEDLETGETIPVSGSTGNTAYFEKLHQHLATLRTRLLDRGIAYTLVNMRQPIEQVLRDFLNQRSKLKA